RALVVDHRRLDAEERQRGRARFLIDGSGQRRDEDAAGLGLPPGVDDGAAAVADHLVVPEPDFGVDRLADGAEQPQRLAAALLDRRLALARDGPDGRGRAVEYV